MLALGYFPADNVENLIEKNRKISALGDLDSWKGMVIEEIKRFSLQMADALTYMKKKKILHRDLKPANILFLSDQNGHLSTIKIIDFGIAISLDPTNKTDLFDEQDRGNTQLYGAGTINRSGKPSVRRIRFWSYRLFAAYRESSHHDGKS